MSMDIRWLTREDVGLTEPNRWSPFREQTTGIFFHHSGTATPSMPKSVDQSKVQWRNIQQDHLSRLILDKNGKPTYWPDGTVRKWADIAYNIGIGYRCVMDGRGLAVQGGGTGWPWDGYTISICTLGNMTIEDLTPDYIETMTFALREIRKHFGDNLTINGDRDVNSTNCPGDHLYEKMKWLWELSGQQDLPSPPPEEDDMGKPLHIIHGKNDYEAQFVRWDNGVVSHLGPGEIAVDAFKNLPHIDEYDRDAYHRLVKLSQTQWRPDDWPPEMDD